ncbi:hypothetical protein [Methylobacterium brachythecii]|uniref:Uncharacterized protein n=1 Tax=Methylobacterium brachythecii TaxID=1176177 RepID=A0A7W6AR71_9HYPH|nr:hypothetical protein [Methylobacterium brachythecii]MBB3905206.1 hypothetical protein [Methylobacterium brachythecii]GLS46221.1 hypothetical protein GCM10007884_42130 [Methylobacterium brachythecii]
MFGRNGKTLVRAATLAASLTGGIAAGSVASAQEAIRLETIGAVRMAQPEEVRRMASEHEAARSVAQGQARGEEREASAR